MSIVLLSGADQMNKQDCLALHTVNDSSTAISGMSSLTVDLGLQHMLWWIFIITNACISIIWEDFPAQGTQIISEDVAWPPCECYNYSANTRYHISYYVSKPASLSPTSTTTIQNITPYLTLLVDFPL